ncbi:hypothetical protein MRX96_007883 [Rhipicephalus microplus]
MLAGPERANRSLGCAEGIRAASDAIPILRSQREAWQLSSLHLPALLPFVPGFRLDASSVTRCCAELAKRCGLELFFVASSCSLCDQPGPLLGPFIAVFVLLAYCSRLAARRGCFEPCADNGSALSEVRLVMKETGPRPVMHRTTAAARCIPRRQAASEEPNRVSHVCGEKRRRRRARDVYAGQNWSSGGVPSTSSRP